MSQQIILEDLAPEFDEVATRSSWKNYPIMESTSMEVELTLSEEDYKNVIKGSIPSQMEDKWFIFFEDGALNFHRSWTGHGVFQAKIVKENNKYLIKEVFVESSFAGDRDSKELFLSLVNKKLLSRE